MNLSLRPSRSFKTSFNTTDSLKLKHLCPSGAGRPRSLRVASFASVALFLFAGLLITVAFNPWLVSAASPNSGTVSPSSNSFQFTGSFTTPNPSDEATGVPTCGNPAPACDSFSLTVANVPAPSTQRFSFVTRVAWTNPVTELDLFIYDSNGNLVGSQASNVSPQTVAIAASEGTSSYTLQIVPTLLAPGGDTYTATVALQPISGVGKVASGIAPRYQNFQAPSNLGNSSGEPSMGVDWTTGKIMYEAGLQTLQVTPSDRVSPSSATWKDVSGTTTSIASLDSILFVDHTNGAHRTFVTQLTGQDSLTEFSDDDGATYTPSQGGGEVSGVDHETVGSGPYAAPLTGVNPVFPNAVYYCSQDIATAFCSRSDDGGVTFAGGVPIYNLTQCGGIHGHVKVAPDGTVYVPNASCLGGQGVAVSKNNGITWTVNEIQGTDVNGAQFTSLPSQGIVDPSIGIGSDGTVYFGYANGDGTPHIAISHDQGTTWVNDQNVGAPAFLQNVTFPEVVAGDASRASFAFLGTQTAGNYQDEANFHGEWHLYIATTYDGGQTYFTVNANPDDPVQRGSICNLGTTACGAHPINDRNLLDFMDAQIDKTGRVHIAYPDGCITPVCINGGANDYTAKATFARQSGGNTLFSKYDVKQPTFPASPRIDNIAKDSSGLTMTWSQPDNGGSPITRYNIYRGTSNNPTTLLVQLRNAAAYYPSTQSYRMSYKDTTAVPGTNYFYSVAAGNSVGQGLPSPTFTTAAAGVASGGTPTTFCDGTNLITDATGDATNPAVGSVGGSTDTVDIKNVSFSYNATAKTLTTTLTLANLSLAPIAGTTDAYYYVVWTGADGNQYATLASEPDPTNQFAFSYGPFNSGNNQLTSSTTTTGTFTQGVNGTISVTVPLSGVGGGAIPVAPSGTPAVRNPFAITISGEGALGTGLVFVAYDDRAPNVGFGPSWSVCPQQVPPVQSNAPFAVLNGAPTNGKGPLTVNFDASGSKNSDGATITDYRFDFGDGSGIVHTSSAKVSHTYKYSGDGKNPTNFGPNLIVTDSNGQRSINVAQQVITVSP